MHPIKKLENYSDNRGNRIIYEGLLEKNITIIFHGSNNTLHLHNRAALHFLKAEFHGDNGRIEIGNNTGVTPLKATMEVGYNSSIIVGNNVSNTIMATLSAVEGEQIIIGNDVMLSSEAEIRTSDSHPIYDVTTGKRVNPAKPIRIGNHVWLARRSTVLGGASIGDGSVLGFASILDGQIPNNSIAAGVPARVVRRDIAWERPHLSLRKPYYKPDASSIQKSEYWALTDDPQPGDSAKSLKSTVLVAGGLISKFTELTKTLNEFRRRNQSKP